MAQHFGKEIPGPQHGVTFSIYAKREGTNKPICDQTVRRQ